MTPISATLLSLALLSAPVAAQGKDPVMPKDVGEIVTTASGLKYSVLTPGAGERPPSGAPVTVHYSGWLTDGTPFDSSVKRGEPFEFVLGQGRVIKGWDEGVALMQKGSRFKFTIPPDLGYGTSGSPPVIPPNATLVFEVELLDFVILPTFTQATPEKQVKLESGIAYEVVEAGTGESARNGQVCVIEYALFSTSGKLVDSSVAQGRNIRDVCGESRMAFMNEVLPLMKTGTSLRLEVPPALAFKDRPMGPDLPPNSNTVWQLRVLEIVEPPAMPEFKLLTADKTVTTASGLKYEVLKAGEGASPKLGQNVTVQYAGWLTDGTLFDASFKRGEPATFQLGRVIKGWNEGLQLMQPGAIMRFEIPSELAYGPRGSPPVIPANATLIFYVELLPDAQ